MNVPRMKSPDVLSDMIYRELAARDAEIEVGLVRRGAPRRPHSVLQPAESLPRTDLPRGGVWVITGGARGITAACALALGQRYGWKLHLIGRSPAPRDDAPWRHYSERQMQAFKASIVHTAAPQGDSPEEDWMRIKKDVEIYDTLGRFRRRACTSPITPATSPIGTPSPRRSTPSAAGMARSRALSTVRAMPKPARFEQRTAGCWTGTVAAKVRRRRSPNGLDPGRSVTVLRRLWLAQRPLRRQRPERYAAANDMLAKLDRRHPRSTPAARGFDCAGREAVPQCAAACLHWQSWDEVGMATFADSVAISKNVLQMAFIPPAEGIEHLHQELRAGLPSPEIVVTDGHFQRTFYPAQRPRHGDLTVACLESVPLVSADLAPQVAESLIRPAAGSLGLPLIESVVRREDGGVAACLRFDPAADPFLLQHRFRDKPFLPAVIGWEALAEAASAAGSGEQGAGSSEQAGDLPHQAGEHFGSPLPAPRFPCRGSAGHTIAALRDLQIVDGMLFHGPQPIEAEVAVRSLFLPGESGRTEVAPHGDVLACELTSRQRDRKGRLINAQRLHMRAIAEFAGGPSGASADGAIEASAARATTLGLVAEPISGKRFAVSRMPLRCLQEWAFQYDGGWGRIVAPAPADLAGPRAASGWILPVAVLDACLYACGAFLYVQFGGQADVPQTLDRLVWTRQPQVGENCTLRFYFQGREQRQSRFDFVFFGADQRPLLQACGFRMVQIAAARTPGMQQSNPRAAARPDLPRRNNERAADSPMQETNHD